MEFNKEIGVDKAKVNKFIEEFNGQSHGSTNLGKEELYVAHGDFRQFVPFEYFCKKSEIADDLEQLLSAGYVYRGLEGQLLESFGKWYQDQFGKKLPAKILKNAYILCHLDQLVISEALEVIDTYYDRLRMQGVLQNSKNLPVQLGEWYAKSIFGLKQVKSSSQRGFDFTIEENRVEVKVHWSEKVSHKGVKIRKSLVTLCDHCIIIYVTKNFLIKDICLLDSSFVLRKFSGKGHTIFLKEEDLAPYYFSKSTKHYNKVINKEVLMKFANPAFALRLDEKFQELK